MSRSKDTAGRRSEVCLNNGTISHTVQVRKPVGNLLQQSTPDHSSSHQRVVSGNQTVTPSTGSSSTPSRPTDNCRRDSTAPPSTASKRKRLFNAIFHRTPVGGVQRSTARESSLSMAHLQRGQYYKWNPDISIVPALPPSVSPERGWIDDEDIRMRLSTTLTSVADNSLADSDVSWKRNGFIESADEDGTDQSEENASLTSSDEREDESFGAKRPQCSPAASSTDKMQRMGYVSILLWQ